MRKSLLAAVAIVICAPVACFLLYQYILDQQCFTGKDFQKIIDGMRQSDIEAILGPPRHVVVKPDGGKEVRWIARNKGMIYVEFDNQGDIIRKLLETEARDYLLSFFPRIRD